MKIKSSKYYILLAAAGLCLLTGCEEQIGSEAVPEQTEAIVVTTAQENEMVHAVRALGIGLDILPSLEGVKVDGSAEELAPVNLTVGVINSVVADLQQRLMDLGYMDPDEPTNYYGEATALAVRYFQRQKGMSEDGVTGIDTWDALMNENAPRYGLKPGFMGNDVVNAQYRLYNLGYLSSAEDMTGVYDDRTMAAVMKLQEINGIAVDGVYGTDTYNLMYSSNVKANVLALGEQSELVKKYQERLIQLGYMEGPADGNFGAGTQSALKAFQSRNDLVVDGFLGMDTRKGLDSSSAKPFAMRLGEQSDSVKELQTKLVKLGYMNSANATGYYGDITKAAVTSFQNRNKLTADGMAGAKTMSVLNSGNAKKADRTTASQTAAPPAQQTPQQQVQAAAQAVTGVVGQDGALPAASGAPVSGSAANLLAIASSKIGCPYVYGAKGSNSFDCSGFVYWCLNQAGVGVSYMTSYEWRNPGRFQRVSSYNDLQAGDIIVVSGHVGIVASGGTIIDASSSNGRVIHRSLGDWWANHFLVGWRIF